MEPIPETRAAADELDPVADDALLLENLTASAARAEELVPDLVGVSVSAPREGLTMTLVASTTQVAVLDAIQYVAGGPCVAALEREEPVAYSPEAALEEGPWQLFAQAAASAPVRSTLTLPVVGENGEVLGSVNLYAASSRAFDGFRDQLAELFGAWAPGAVSNADLSFHSRVEAQEAPRRLAERAKVETAVGIVAAETGSNLETARRRSEEAAARARVSLLELAEAVLSTRSSS